jgi:hypothetical protein
LRTTFAVGGQTYDHFFTVVTADPISGAWVLNGTFSTVLRLLTVNDPQFAAYDAPMSFMNDIMVIMDVNISAKTSSAATISLLPPGWSAQMGTFLRLMYSGGGVSTLNSMKTALTTYMNSLGTNSESADIVTELNDMIAFFDVYTPILPQFGLLDTAMKAQLNLVLSAYQQYAVPDTKDPYVLFIDDLMDQYVPPMQGGIARLTPLKDSELGFIISGYFAAHQKFLVNPTNIKREVPLWAGAGTFMRVSGIS